MIKACRNFRDVVYLFALFCVLFIPITLHIFTFQPAVTQAFFGQAISAIAEIVFRTTLLNPKISSDSLSMYILVLLLLGLSILISLLLNLIKRWNEKRESTLAALHRFFCYYLSLALLQYGFDKVFKSQFYLPEPNTLYTPIGQVSKDLLYWSTIGTSYSYTVFLGLLEVITAIFIIIKRTRVLGLLMSVIIMLHVVVINFSFDISVKIYSTFLLYLSVLLIYHQINKLYRFLILQETAELKPQPVFFPTFKNIFLRVSLKTFLICILFLEALYPHFRAQNFNDDLVQRPYLHGAYEVKEIRLGRDTLSLYASPVKRFFIHRNGYIIFQNSRDSVQDFKLVIDSNSHQFLLTNYQNHQTKLKYWHYEKDSILELQYFIQDRPYILKTKVLNWKLLPLLQRDFHWTVDKW